MARMLGVDYGERRIGLAVSDPGGTIAMPLAVVAVRAMAEAVEAVAAASRDKQAEAVVVGLPLNMNGTEGPAAQTVRTFCERLRGAVGVPVETWDERLSTASVERMLIASHVRREQRRDVRDKLAAQVILQGYLDTRVPGSGVEGLDGRE